MSCEEIFKISSKLARRPRGSKFEVRSQKWPLLTNSYNTHKYIISQTVSLRVLFLFLLPHFLPCWGHFWHFWASPKIGYTKFWPPGAQNGCQNGPKGLKWGISLTMRARMLLFVPITTFSTLLNSFLTFLSISKNWLYPILASRSSKWPTKQDKRAQMRYFTN